MDARLNVSNAPLQQTNDKPFDQLVPSSTRTALVAPLQGASDAIQAIGTGIKKGAQKIVNTLTKSPEDVVKDSVENGDAVAENLQKGRDIIANKLPLEIRAAREYVSKPIEVLNRDVTYLNPATTSNAKKVLTAIGNYHKRVNKFTDAVGCKVAEKTFNVASRILSAICFIFNRLGMVNAARFVSVTLPRIIASSVRLITELFIGIVCHILPYVLAGGALAAIGFGLSFLSPLHAVLGAIVILFLLSQGQIHILNKKIAELTDAVMPVQGPQNLDDDKIIVRGGRKVEGPNTDASDKEHLEKLNLPDFFELAAEPAKEPIQQPVEVVKKPVEVIKQPVENRGSMFNPLNWF